MWARTTDGGTLVAVWVQPRAARDGVVGERGDALKVRVAAPPVDGAANTALTVFLAKALGVPRGAVTVVAGLGSRRKTVRVQGLGPDAVRAALTPPPPAPPP